MLSELKNRLRRRLRGMTRAGEFPVLLPHFRVMGDGLSELEQTPRPLTREQAKALSLCDGKSKLRQIAAEAGVKADWVIEQADEGRVVFWPSPICPGLHPGLNGRVGEWWVPMAVVLSPHPDDAVLSACHELIFHEADDPRGVPLVVNVFSRTAWSRFPDVLRVPEQVQQIRRAEEELVARLTGNALHQMDLPEALLRGYTMENVFGEVHRDDARTMDEVAARVKQVAEKLGAAVPWVLPLGVGGHVDHRIAREGALAGLEAAGVEEDQISFYEDLPYAAAMKGPADFSQMIRGRRLVRSGGRNPKLLDYKRRLMRVYWSQLTLSQIRQVEEYSRKGEWRWRVAR